MAGRNPQADRGPANGEACNVNRKGKYPKRIYNLSSFFSDIRQVFHQMTALREISKDDRIDRAFAERIMLAVTQVNDCRYCRYGHTRAALAAGVEEKELVDLLQGEFGSIPQEQVVAITFAQHVAEQGGHPDPAASQRLVDVYGVKTAQQINAYIHMITIGNLLGNTFDAILSRFLGRPAEGSHLYEEVAVLLLTVLLAPLALFAILTFSIGRQLKPASSQVG